MDCIDEHVLPVTNTKLKLLSFVVLPGIETRNAAKQRKKILRRSCCICFFVYFFKRQVYPSISLIIEEANVEKIVVR